MDEQHNARPAQDGFMWAAVHSITHTVPRAGRRERLVPWTLAVVITIGVGVAGAGFALAAYTVMWIAVAAVVVLTALAASKHAWRASTRYKRPLDAPVDPLQRR